MSGRDIHFEAVGFAGFAVQEFQEVLQGVATDRMENALGTIISAVGEDPNTESGRMALEIALRIRQTDLPDLIRYCEEIKAELIRYGNGF